MLRTSKGPGPSWASNSALRRGGTSSYKVVWPEGHREPQPLAVSGLRACCVRPIPQEALMHTGTRGGVCVTWLPLLNGSFLPRGHYTKLPVPSLALFATSSSSHVGMPGRLVEQSTPRPLSLRAPHTLRMEDPENSCLWVVSIFYHIAN